MSREGQAPKDRIDFSCSSACLGRMSTVSPESNGFQKTVLSPGVLLVAAVLFVVSLQAGRWLGTQVSGGPDQVRKLAQARASSGGALPILQAAAEAISGNSLTEKAYESQIQAAAAETKQLQEQLATVDESITNLRAEVTRIEGEAATAESQAKAGPADKRRTLEAEMAGLVSLKQRAEDLRAASAAEVKAAGYLKALPGQEIPADLASLEAAQRTEWVRLLEDANTKIGDARTLHDDLAAKQKAWETKGSLTQDDRTQAIKLKNEFEAAVTAAESAVQKATADLAKAVKDTANKWEALRGPLEAAVKQLPGGTPP